MDLQQKTKRFGFFVILCACILRLFSAGAPDNLMRWLTDVNNVPFLKYLETGRNVRFSASVDVFLPHFRESPAPWIQDREKPRFTAEDAALVEVDYDCVLRPDLEALLEKPLDWNLQQEEPTVLILHTHTTESYTQAAGEYTETSAYRTLDEAYNMLSIGDAVAEILMQAGIGVIHDRVIHDYPSYNGSYVHARSSLEVLLEQYPSVQLILDLHRDAVEVSGKQLRTKVETEDGVSAQLMFVVGTDASGLIHGQWEENLALAMKLHVQLQRLMPGIMRPLNLRAQRFNQDLSKGAILVEVGTAGNSHDEALAAARALAAAVAELALGTENTQYALRRE